MVAGQVCRQGQELVRVACGTVIGHSRGSRRKLPLPNGIGTAIGRDIQRDVAKAGPARVVRRAPADQRIVAATQRGCGQLGLGRNRVGGLFQRGRRLRRLRIHDDPGGRRDGRARRYTCRQLRRPADVAGTCAARVVWAQQPTRTIPQYVAG